MPHLVLLGDSAFENSAYTGGGPDVAAHVRHLLPDGWRLTVLATDGARIQDVRQQLAALPEEASHLALSVGGNDALAEVELLRTEVANVAEALGRLRSVSSTFRSAYSDLLAHGGLTELPLAVCTIYDPRFEDTRLRRLATAGLVHFNDVVLRQAFQGRLSVIDLRLVCRRDQDYTLEIEPSEIGGRRIAAAVAAWATDATPSARVYGDQAASSAR